MPIKSFLNWLRPHEHEVYDLMDEAGRDLLAGSEEILAAIRSGTQPDFAALRERMLLRKERMDHLRDRLVEGLSHRFMPAIEGESALGIAREMHGIQDHLDGTAELLSVYGVPSEGPAVLSLAENAVSAMRAVTALIRSLSGERTPMALKDHMEELHRIEKEADGHFRGALERLYSAPANPIVLIETKDLLKRLEDTVDHMQHVAKTIYTAVMFD